MATRTMAGASCPPSPSAWLLKPAGRTRTRGREGGVRGGEKESERARGGNSFLMFKHSNTTSALAPLVPGMGSAPTICPFRTRSRDVAEPITDSTSTRERVEDEYGRKEEKKYSTCRRAPYSVSAPHVFSRVLTREQHQSCFVVYLCVYKH